MSWTTGKGFQEATAHVQNINKNRDNCSQGRIFKNKEGLIVCQRESVKQCLQTIYYLCMLTLKIQAKKKHSATNLKTYTWIYHCYTAKSQSKTRGFQRILFSCLQQKNVMISKKRSAFLTKLSSVNCIFWLTELHPSTTLPKPRGWSKAASGNIDAARHQRDINSTEYSLQYSCLVLLF